MEFVTCFCCVFRYEDGFLLWFVFFCLCVLLLSEGVLVSVVLSYLEGVGLSAVCFVCGCLLWRYCVVYGDVW